MKTLNWILLSASTIVYGILAVVISTKETAPQVTNSHNVTNNYYVVVECNHEENIEDEEQVEDKVSIRQKLVDFLKEKEGFRGTRYVCKGGAVTIGYGFTDGAVWEGKKYGFLPDNYKLPKKMSQAEAEKFLVNVVIPSYEKIVDEKVNVKLTEHQKIALISFAFNLGRTPLTNIAEDINKGNDPCERILKYRFAKGKELKGLSIRRNAEVAFYKGEF